MGLIRKTVSEFMEKVDYGIEYEDLVNECVLALIKTFDKYGDVPTSYIRKRIFGAIVDHLRKDYWVDRRGWGKYKNNSLNPMVISKTVEYKTITNQEPVYPSDIEALMNMLPNDNLKLKEVTRKFYFEHKRAIDIAKELGMTKEMVEYRLYKARKIWRKEAEGDD